VYRFLELGTQPSLLARSLSLVMNQRLVRRICPQCRDEGSQADPSKLGSYGISLTEAKSLRLFKGRGCSDCNRLGYRRRKGRLELIVVEEHCREKLLGQPTLAEIEASARSAGMEPVPEWNNPSASQRSCDVVNGEELWGWEGIGARRLNEGFEQ